MLPLRLSKVKESLILWFQWPVQIPLVLSVTSVSNGLLLNFQQKTDEEWMDALVMDKFSFINKATTTNVYLVDNNKPAQVHWSFQS